jgi:hypothetical protein
MKHLPSELFLMIFERFLPPLVCDTTITNHTPLEEQVKLLKNLVVCQSVCRRWRGIIQEMPSLFSRDTYHAAEESPVSREVLRLKRKCVKGLVVTRVSSVGSTFNSVPFAYPNVTYVSWTCAISCDNYPRHVSYLPLNHLRRLDW